MRNAKMNPIEILVSVSFESCTYPWSWNRGRKWWVP